MTLKMTQSMMQNAGIKIENWLHDSKDSGQKMRLYRTIHLYTRKRAPWPVWQIGPAPKNDEEEKLVRRFCLQNHLAKPQHSPRTALQEYKAWWLAQRKNRSPDQQRQGDDIKKIAESLIVALGSVPSKSRLAQDLLKCKDDLLNWPKELDMPTPSSQLERDVYQDWLFVTERAIRSHMPEEFSRNRYRY